METLADEHLMALAQDGDREALATLVTRYHAPLLGYLYRLTDGDRPLAEDLCQEAFARLLQPAGYQSGRPFRPWLYAIATNLARDLYRSAATRRRATTPIEAIPERPDRDLTPEARIVVAEEAQALRAVLNTLGEEYRATLILRFYQELRLEEIATALNIPLGTVKSRLSVGVRRLRQALAEMREGVHP